MCQPLAFRFRLFLDQGPVLFVVRQGLLEAFDSNVLPYLSRPDFPERFMRSEYTRCLKSKAYR